jgi:exopolysaccharide biosynthesis polyprenyl glycosylphosphotransferase
MHVSFDVPTLNAVERQGVVTMTTTGLPTVASTLAETFDVATHAGLLPTRVRGSRVPWLQIAIDVAAAAVVAAVVGALLPTWSPLALLALVAGWPVLAALSGAYSTGGLRYAVRPRSLLRAAGAGAMVAWSLVAISPELVPGSAGDGARAILLLVVLTPAISLGLRASARHLATPASRVVLVGDAATVLPLLHEAGRETGLGRRPQMLPVAVCLPGPESLEAVTSLVDAAPDLTIWQSCDDFLDVVRAHRTDAVVVAPGAEISHHELRRWGAWLQDAGIELMVSSGLRDVAPSRVELSRLGGARLLRVRPAAISGPSYFVKSLVDRVAAAVLLVILAPLLLVLAVLVRLDSAGPALYTQTRIGRHGRPFTVFKIRTMHQDSDERLDQLVSENAGVLFKIRRDPRITRLGGMLRTSSLDELPQLINVVRGEMSLIGPRPALPTEVRAYSTDLRRRLAVKPGITGLWQVSGRSDLSWEDTVRLDLEYVDNWSWSLDLRLAAMTFGAVVGHKGAY